MGLQSIFVGGRYLGSRQIPNDTIDRGELRVTPLHSYAFFCLSCGDIWARLVHDRARLTQCRHLSCSTHGAGKISQSLWPEETATFFNSSWPADAVRYEFERELATLEV